MKKKIAHATILLTLGTSLIGPHVHAEETSYEKVEAENTHKNVNTSQSDEALKNENVSNDDNRAGHSEQPFQEKETDEGITSDELNNQESEEVPSTEKSDEVNDNEDSTSKSEPSEETPESEEENETQPPSEENGDNELSNEDGTSNSNGNSESDGKNDVSDENNQDDQNEGSQEGEPNTDENGSSEKPHDDGNDSGTSEEDTSKDDNDSGTSEEDTSKDDNDSGTSEEDTSKDDNDSGSSEDDTSKDDNENKDDSSHSSSEDGQTNDSDKDDQNEQPSDQDGDSHTTPSNQDDNSHTTPSNQDEDSQDSDQHQSKPSDNNDKNQSGQSNSSDSSHQIYGQHQGQNDQDSKHDSNWDDNQTPSGNSNQDTSHQTSNDNGSQSQHHQSSNRNDGYDYQNGYKHKGEQRNQNVSDAMIHQIYPNKNHGRNSQMENHYASSNQSNTKPQWHYGQSTTNDDKYNDHQFNHQYVSRDDNNASGNNGWTSLLHRFNTLATGSYKYNPFIINRVNRLGENEDNVTDQDFYRLFQKQTFNNEYLNSLQRKSNYFRFEYFNPLNAREYYKNLDEQVLGLITGEIGSMPDLKKPSDKHSSKNEDEADIHSHKKIIESNDDEKSETKGKDNIGKVNITLISSIIIIFLGIIGRYLFKLLKN